MRIGAWPTGKFHNGGLRFWPQNCIRVAWAKRIFSSVRSASTASKFPAVRTREYIVRFKRSSAAIAGNCLMSSNGGGGALMRETWSDSRGFTGRRFHQWCWLQASLIRHRSRSRRWSGTRPNWPARLKRTTLSSHGTIPGGVHAAGISWRKTGFRSARGIKPWRPVQINSLMRFSRNSCRPLTLGVTSPCLSM